MEDESKDKSVMSVKANGNCEDPSASTYLTLLEIITSLENRLLLSEFIYLFLNISMIITTTVLFFYFKITFGANIVNKIFNGAFDPSYIFLIFIVIGEFSCVYWVISSMKIQLKLKLRYFQARAIERKLDRPGESIITDESMFFNPKIGSLKSFDNQEEVSFPREGAVRMDGFAGSAKPRHLTWFLPSFLFFIYTLLFVGIAFSTVS